MGRHQRRKPKGEADLYVEENPLAKKRIFIYMKNPAHHQSPITFHLTKMLQDRQHSYEH